MASEQQVKEYLAYWLQLGKRVMIRNGQSICALRSVLAGERFSAEFEACWSQIMAVAGRDCYIEGTTITIDQLLSSAWDVDACARCEIPVGTPVVMCDQFPCPCSDLMNWPNTELPHPRLPISSQDHLVGLRNRLQDYDEADQDQRPDETDTERADTERETAMSDDAETLNQNLARLNAHRFKP